MNSRAKFWLGIFTFLPFVFLIIFLVLFFSFILEFIVVQENQHLLTNTISLITSSIWLIILIILTTITSFAIKIYYIIHVNKSIDSDINKKILWTLVLVFAGSIASVIYYFIEITPIKSLKN